MENQIQPQMTEKNKHSSKLLTIVLVVLLLIGVGLGIYYWQQSKLTSLSEELSNLQSQTDEETTDKTEESSDDTFVYKPTAGGLTLTLPKSYGVVVQIDGNKGGASGARFSVASVEESNIFIDHDYNGIQFDIDQLLYDNVAEALDFTVLKLEKDRGVQDYEISDLTIAGLPAKRIQVNDSTPYYGNLDVYIMTSGSYTYTITVNGVRGTSLMDISPILEGINIAPVE